MGDMQVFLGPVILCVGLFLIGWFYDWIRGRRNKRDIELPEREDEGDR
ncbi:MAG: hypothetical protein C1O27_002199 [Chloroflexi bacterium]|jgi:hypothetical protein|nr:MAG: hypothetical protein C1O27_002199 [Chloroflexota bacterium]